MTGLMGFLIPLVIVAAPTEFINVPRKDYWLAPERREETFRFLRTHLEWFACGVLFVLLYAASQAINANLPEHAPFGARGLFYVLAGFLLLTLAGSIRLMRHFYRVPRQDSSS